MDIETRVGRLEDVERIRSLKAHYCDLCDAGYEVRTCNTIWVSGGKPSG